MSSLTATGSAGLEASSASNQIDMDEELPSDMLNTGDVDSESDEEGAGAGYAAAGAGSGEGHSSMHPLQHAAMPAPQPKHTLNQLLAQHQPITLVNGQRINQGFRKPEKTKWTAEEGPCPFY